MIKCPECRKDVSETAKACPSCGFAVAEAVAKSKQEKAKAEAKVAVANMWRKMMSSPMALVIIGAVCLLIAVGSFGRYYEAANHPEKAVERHKAEMKKQLDEVNELRAKNGNLGSFSDFSAEYDIINRVDYSDMVESDKSSGIAGTVIFGAIGVFALLRWRVVKRRLRVASGPAALNTPSLQTFRPKRTPRVEAPPIIGDKSGPKPPPLLDVVLVGVPADTKIAVMKAVCEVKPGLGLAEAKELVETLPSKVFNGVSETVARVAKEKLEQAGAASAKSEFYPTFFLCLFLGVFGVHRFYNRKFGTGVLQLVTLGGLGCWWFGDLLVVLLGKFKDKNGVAIQNINPKMSWAVAAVVIVIGFASGSANSRTGASNGSNSTTSSSAPEAIRKKYAGVYETTSGSLTFAGGLGLFASGDYTLMFGQSDKFSGTWTVEGSTIRLKGSSSTDTVLRILNSEQLAYERNGVEVIYTLKERQ